MLQGSRKVDVLKNRYRNSFRNETLNSKGGFLFTNLLIIFLAVTYSRNCQLINIWGFTKWLIPDILHSSFNEN